MLAQRGNNLTSPRLLKIPALGLSEAKHVLLAVGEKKLDHKDGDADEDGRVPLQLLLGSKHERGAKDALG